MESCAFLAQCALIFELQPSSFPSDRSKIESLPIHVNVCEVSQLGYRRMGTTAGHVRESGRVRGRGDEVF
jgi:hypothetical protein